MSFVNQRVWLKVESLKEKNYIKSAMVHVPQTQEKLNDNLPFHIVTEDSPVQLNNDKFWRVKVTKMIA